MIFNQWIPSFKLQKLLNYWATTSWLPAMMPFLTLRVTLQNCSTSGRKPDEVMFLFITPLIIQLWGFQFQPGSCSIYLHSRLPHIQINKKYICTGCNYVTHIQSSQTKSLFQQTHTTAEPNRPQTPTARTALSLAPSPDSPTCTRASEVSRAQLHVPSPVWAHTARTAHRTSRSRCTLRSRKRSAQVGAVKDQLKSKQSNNSDHSVDTGGSFLHFVAPELF